MTSHSLRHSPLPAVVCGGIILGVALGTRHVQGLFLPPMTMEHGWGREVFGFALALQNLAWGLTQPLTGMIADRFGSARVLFLGVLAYAAGLYLQAVSDTPGALSVSAGLIIGFALSGTAFGAVYGALSRILSPERRSWGLGLAGAIGGLGQFLMVPLAQGLIGTVGWMRALMLLAALCVVLAPLTVALRDRPQGVAGAPSFADIGAAVRAALSHRGFGLLNLGFLACGFQLAFIASHLPAYLLDRGLGPREGVTALALIALANVVGTYYCGHLGGKYRRKHLLAGLYLVRACAIAIFVATPLAAPSVYVFAVVMGATWLGTVPLTNGLVAQIFGVRYIATLFGFVFLGHQLGSFAGVWLGGYFFDTTHSYQAVWLIAIALGVVAAALHLLIDDTPQPASRLASAQA